MADLKISQLTAVTTPLAGTEVLPIVQSSTTKKVTVDQMIAAQLAANIVTESGTSRTLTAADNQKVIYCTSGSAVTITCATGLGVGFNCTIIQGGAGKVTVAAGAATLNSYSGLLSTMGQYAVISLISPVADEFIAAGNLGV
jgi:hypothetical protein